jgi:hypothetical protein
MVWSHVGAHRHGHIRRGSGGIHPISLWATATKGQGTSRMPTVVGKRAWFAGAAVLRSRTSSVMPTGVGIQAPVRQAPVRQAPVRQAPARAAGTGPAFGSPVRGEA